MPFKDLMRVSQNIVTSRDEGPLYLELNNIFSQYVKPTSLHKFIASLDSRQDADRKNHHPLFVTTNYDDSIERALEPRSFEVIYFNPVSDDPFGGRFYHKTHEDCLEMNQGRPT